MAQLNGLIGPSEMLAWARAEVVSKVMHAMIGIDTDIK